MNTLDSFGTVEATIFNELLDDWGHIDFMADEGSDDASREELGRLVDSGNNVVEKRSILDSDLVVDGKDSFNDLEFADEVIIDNSVGDFFVDGEDLVFDKSSSSGEAEVLLKEVDQEEGLDVLGVVLDGNDDHFLDFVEQVRVEFLWDVDISIKDVQDTDFRELVKVFLELSLELEEDAWDLVLRWVQVEFHISQVLEDKALLIIVEFLEHGVQVSLNVVNNEEFLLGGIASLSGGSLEDLDNGERSQELEISLEFVVDLVDDVISVSSEGRQVIVQIDEVSEVEGLALDEFGDLGEKLVEVLVLDVDGKLGDLESSQPENEIEDFIFIKLFKAFLGLCGKVDVSLISVQKVSLGRVGLDESGEDSESQNDVLVLVQAEILVHDVE